MREERCFSHNTQKLKSIDKCNEEVRKGREEKRKRNGREEEKKKKLQSKSA